MGLALAAACPECYQYNNFNAIRTILALHKTIHGSTHHAENYVTLFVARLNSSRIYAAYERASYLRQRTANDSSGSG
jgi:hypothetical protein